MKSAEVDPEELPGNIALSSDDRIQGKLHITNVKNIEVDEEWDNFDETVCCFFFDADPVIENYKEFGITDEQNQIFKKFRDELDRAIA